MSILDSRTSSDRVVDDQTGSPDSNRPAVEFILPGWGEGVVKKLMNVTNQICSSDQVGDVRESPVQSRSAEEFVFLGWSGRVVIMLSNIADSTCSLDLVSERDSPVQPRSAVEFIIPDLGEGDVNGRRRRSESSSFPMQCSQQE